ncbi:hypothetical protein C9I99_26750 [Photobacterium lutimaris]|uniref:Uncharacterized protein n=1 Tax=Photobacterium lutimaris TaxID=388278 RepID=A0A2T3IHE3_9GAMM|nr:hypothetical protein C9I99_26750 [Photobacterium lutimaris]
MVLIKVSLLLLSITINLFLLATRILIFQIMEKEQTIFMFIGGIRPHGKVQLVVRQFILVNGKTSWKKYQVAQES